jgi:hypothetical protein
MRVWKKWSCVSRKNAWQNIVVRGYPPQGELVKDAGAGAAIAFNMLWLVPLSGNDRFLPIIDTHIPGGSTKGF